MKRYILLFFILIACNEVPPAESALISEFSSEIKRQYKLGRTYRSLSTDIDTVSSDGHKTEVIITHSFMTSVLVFKMVRSKVRGSATIYQGGKIEISPEFQEL